MGSVLEASVASALDEDGPAVSAWELLLFLGGIGLEGAMPSATCFPLALIPAEDSGTGAEQSEAPADGEDPKRPKSSSTGKKQVSIG